MPLCVLLPVGLCKIVGERELGEQVVQRESLAVERERLGRVVLGIEGDRAPFTKSSQGQMRCRTPRVA